MEQQETVDKWGTCGRGVHTRNRREPQGRRRKRSKRTFSEGWKSFVRAGVRVGEQAASLGGMIANDSVRRLSTGRLRGGRTEEGESFSVIPDGHVLPAVFHDSARVTCGEWCLRTFFNTHRRTLHWHKKPSYVIMLAVSNHHGKWTKLQSVVLPPSPPSPSDFSEAMEVDLGFGAGSFWANEVGGNPDEKFEPIPIRAWTVSLASDRRHKLSQRMWGSHCVLCPLLRRTRGAPLHVRQHACRCDTPIARNLTA